MLGAMLVPMHVGQAGRHAFGAICLTIAARFALHLESRIPPQFLEQLRQDAEVRETEVGPARGYVYEGIQAFHVRPTGRKLP
jgi:hypothetical protein